MTRWGKPTKNTRRGNPRYRLDELGANPPPLEGNENDRAMSLAGEFLQMAKAEHEHSQRMGGEGNPALIPVIDRLVDMRRGHVLLPEDLLAFIDSPEVEESGLQADFRAKAGIFAAPQRMNESKQPTTKTLMEGFNRFLNESMGGLADYMAPSKSDAFQYKMANGMHVIVTPTGVIENPASGKDQVPSDWERQAEQWGGVAAAVAAANEGDQAAIEWLKFAER